MNKKTADVKAPVKAKAVEPPTVAEPVVVGPTFLVEGHDGGAAQAIALEQPLEEPNQRVIVAFGVKYVHVAETTDGQWIYRADVR